MLMQKTKVILLVLIFYLLLPAHGDNSHLSTQDLIKKFQNGDESVLPELTARKEEVIKLLKNPYGDIDITALLKNLGADQYKTREDATLKLSSMGPSAFPAVKSYLEKNKKDPEIRLRCKRILEQPASEKQQLSEIQTIKFFISLDDLDPDTIQHFAKAYRVYFNYYKKLPEKEKLSVEHLTRFLRQLVLIKENKDLVNALLEGISVQEFKTLAASQMENSLDEILPVLLKLNNRLPVVTELMLGDFREKVREEEWILLLQQLSSQNNLHFSILSRIKDCKNLPLPFRKNAVLFLKSDNSRLIILGLYLYQGDYKDIAETLNDIFQNKITSKHLGTTLDNAFCDLKLSPENAYLLLELIADNPNPFFSGRSLPFIAKQTEKLPKDKINAKIKDSPIKEKWAEILGKRYPELRPELSSLLYQELLKTNNADDFYNYLAVLNDPLAFSFIPGALDDLWLKFITKEREKYNQLYRAAVIIKVSPALLLREMKKNSDKMEKYNNDQIVQCAEYLLQSTDPAVRDGVIKFLWEKIKNDKSGKKDYYNRVELFQAIIDAKPETTGKLLLKKAKWFLDDPGEKGHALYYCMFLSPGNHGDRFTDITAFFLKNEAEIVKLLKQDFVNGEDFPFVAIFAMNKKMREKYGDLLKKRLLHDIPHIRNSPHLLQCAVITGSALDLKHPELDNALISLIKTPPKYLHYMDETMLSLGKNQAHLVPKLLEMDKGVEKAPFPFDTAIFIDSNNPEVVGYGKDLVLKSDSHAVACNAALALEMVGKMLSLKDIPAERINWFLKISKDDLFDTEKFIRSFDDPEDQKELLKLLVPSFRKIAEIQTYDPGLTELFWRKPANQKVVIEEIVSMMESNNEKHRSMAINMLASAPMAAADYLDRIHACLKKQTDKRKLNSLLWAISNIGKVAAPMQKTVAEIHESENHVAFCLANICADPMDRRKYLLKLIERYKENHDSTTVRMIGLVKGQPDITRPFLKEIVNKVIDPKTEEDKKLYSYYACEGVWGLAREKPDDDIYQFYLNLLKKAKEDSPAIGDNLLDAVLWSLRNYYPDKLQECREILKELPFRFKISKYYRKTIEQIKEK